MWGEVSAFLISGVRPHGCFLRPRGALWWWREGLSSSLRVGGSGVPSDKVVFVPSLGALLTSGAEGSCSGF